MSFLVIETQRSLRTCWFEVGLSRGCCKDHTFNMPCVYSYLAERPYSNGVIQDSELIMEDKH